MILPIGAVHVHKYYLVESGPFDFFDNGVSSESFAKCRQDVFANWPKYKELYLKKFYFGELGRKRKG
jgi:hypothetical protein